MYRSSNNCLFVGCLTSQQQASVSQGRICSDNLTCCHTEIQVADPTFHLPVECNRYIPAAVTNELKESDQLSAASTGRFSKTKHAFEFHVDLNCSCRTGSLEFPANESIGEVNRRTKPTVIPFFCVPQLYLWASPFGWDFFAYVTVLFFVFFNPTKEVVTFRLRGWCMLGVFLLSASTRLGHGCQDSFEPVRWNACVHRLDLGVYSHPIFFGNRVRAHVNSKGKIPSTGCSGLTSPDSSSTIVMDGQVSELEMTLRTIVWNNIFHLHTLLTKS